MSKTRIKAAAVKKGGKVTSKKPPAHHKDIGVSGGERGFKTSDNKFVGRGKAARIADKAGQTKRKVSKLHSGNVW